MPKQKDTITAALETLNSTGNFQILKRIEESPATEAEPDLFLQYAAIIDLETMGLNPEEDAIIEIGLLIFGFDTAGHIKEVIRTYNGLADPGIPIPENITNITGITAADVQGQSIEWNLVHQLLSTVSFILCHNSGFDRKFLELQTPQNIADLITSKSFACTVKDINWSQRGFESAKLEYLNYKLGYFYEGHRALTDCWATLNILAECEGTLLELLANMQRQEILICAANAPFEKKDMLKGRGYRWSDGSNGLPKSWWTTIEENKLVDEYDWLDNEIYRTKGRAEQLPQNTINAITRYSNRVNSLT